MCNNTLSLLAFHRFRGELLDTAVGDTSESFRRSANYIHLCRGSSTTFASANPDPPKACRLSSKEDKEAAPSPRLQRPEKQWSLSPLCRLEFPTFSSADSITCFLGLYPHRRYFASLLPVDRSRSGLLILITFVPAGSRRIGSR